MRDSVSSDMQGSIFDKIQDVLIADETCVRYIFSKEKKLIGSKRRSEVIKIYAN